jgi:tryptophanyl-tRNA synthetase
MSKTDDPRGCVEIFDEPEEIKKKVMAAVTDPGKVIKYDPVKKPGISNLLTIYSLFTQATAKGGEETLASSTTQATAKGQKEDLSSSPSGKSIKELERSFKGKGYEDFKKSLIKILINSLEPFRRKRKELLQREVYVKEILEQGRKRAQVIAQSTLQDVRKKMGLI